MDGGLVHGSGLVGVFPRRSRSCDTEEAGQRLTVRHQAGQEPAEGVAWRVVELA
ncbi:hypothetical protein ACFFOP_24275 [Sinosporangium siamense]|uniref:hypothetical protein n=1 Tax=Sinosporangium siamense TaxID=1367973 RepID=UPI0035EB0449